jgi:hypothetical protein
MKMIRQERRRLERRGVDRADYFRKEKVNG